ncbi:MAG: hypothetical protein ABIO81_00900 [Ginsengibacter sp.]
MKGQHHYNLTIEWTGNTGTGTTNYQSYNRDYIVSAENKAYIFSSADPSFRGDKTKYNP